MRLIAALAAAGAIAAAGCGGDDDDNGSGLDTSDLSKEEWIVQANQICAEGDREAEAKAETFFAGASESKPPSEEQIAKFTREVAVPGIQAQIDGIRALGAPEGDEDEVEAFLDAGQEGVDAAKEDPAALEGGALDEATTLARQYGLEACGGDGE
jgi:hypothetical protein